MIRIRGPREADRRLCWRLGELAWEGGERERGGQMIVVHVLQRHRLGTTPTPSPSVPPRPTRSLPAPSREYSPLRPAAPPACLPSPGPSVHRAFQPDLQSSDRTLRAYGTFLAHPAQHARHSGPRHFPATGTPVTLPPRHPPSSAFLSSQPPLPASTDPLQSRTSPNYSYVAPV